MKKIIALTVVLVLVSTFSIYAGSQSETTEQKKTEVTMWIMETVTPHIQNVKDSIVEFEEQNPSIDVTLETIALDAWYPKAMTAMQSGDLPDIMYLDSLNKVAILYGKDLLQPVDDVIDILGRDEFPQRILERYSEEGSVWSVPDQVLYQAVFYRKDLFEKNGITEFPTTWDELYEIAEKLTVDENGDGTPDVYGMGIALSKHMVSDQTYGAFMYGNGAHVFNPETGDYEFGDKKEEAVEAMDFLIKMYENVSPPGSINWAWSEYRGAFVQGKTAMTPAWGAVVAKAQEENPDMLDNIGIFPFPAGISGGQYPPDTVGAGKSISLIKSTSDQDRIAAAKDLLVYLMQPETVANRANTRPVFAIPAMDSAFNSATYQSNPMVMKFAEDTRILFDQVIPYIFRPGGEGGLNPVGGNIEATDIFGNAIHNVILQGWSSEKAVDWIDEQIQVLLQE